MSVLQSVEVRTDGVNTSIRQVAWQQLSTRPTAPTIRASTASGTKTYYTYHYKTIWSSRLPLDQTGGATCACRGSELLSVVAVSNCGWTPGVCITNDRVCPRLSARRVDTVAAHRWMRAGEWGSKRCLILTKSLQVALTHFTERTA